MPKEIWGSNPYKGFFGKISQKSKLFGLVLPDLEHHQIAAGLEKTFLLNF
jgi:hypothetical protein